MKKIVVITAATAALAVAGPAAAGSFKGVVLARQAHGHVLVVASAGAGRTVHVSASSAKPGAVVAVTAAKRANGTWAASRVRVTGRASRARVRGVIVRRAGSLTFLSTGRSVLALRSGARRLASASVDPAAGTVANVGVSVAPSGQLTTTSVTPVGQTNSVVIQATVAAVAPGQLTLTINGQTLVVPLPAGTVVPATLVAGATVQLTLDFSAGTTTGSNPQADDEDDQGDDDQGDDDSSESGQHQGGGNNGGDQGDDDGGDD